MQLGGFQSEAIESSLVSTKCMVTYCSEVASDSEPKPLLRQSDLYSQEMNRMYSQGTKNGRSFPFVSKCTGDIGECLCREQFILG